MMLMISVSGWSLGWQPGTRFPVELMIRSYLSEIGSLIVFSRAGKSHADWGHPRQVNKLEQAPLSQQCDS